MPAEAGSAHPCLKVISHGFTRLLDAPNIPTGDDHV
jgi:hypothetical protein